MRIIRKVLWLCFLISLAGILFALGYYFAVTKNISLDPQKLILSEKTLLVYDEQGETIQGAAATALRQTTSISNLPDHTINAFVDVEDKRFFEHNGFDLHRIIGATLRNVKARSFKEGASTISQQLIKNTHLSQEKTFKRKLREWKLTQQLERNYSKDEILEKYLNTIYFGHSCFGITSAADFYFKKTPDQLSLADSAILAALVKSPNNYSPFKNPELCIKRKSVVLRLMQENGSINEIEKNAATNEPLPIQEIDKSVVGYMSFVFDELNAIAEKNDFKIGGNIEIHTYLNRADQKKLEELAALNTNSDKAMMILDNHSHGFKACVSSVGNIQRLPGSLIKPLLVYTPALEEKIVMPATPILDEKVNYSGYSPENYDGNYHGYVSTRECVEKSLNIPAVKTLEALGVKKAANYMEKLNLSVDQEDLSLALALGGMKKGYSLKELTAAYSVLPNRGVLNECGFISSVLVNGVKVYSKPNASKRVFSEESAYLMTNMLQGTAKNGTAKKLRSLPFDIAAKTGTVGTNKGNTDAYALSYTPFNTISVWLGNADNSRIEYTGGGAPCNLLFEINEYLYNKNQKEGIAMPTFPRPEGVTEIALDKKAYYDTHTLCLADDIAPEEYRFTELFSIAAIPLNKSDSFSNPSIFTPSLALKNGKVIISLDTRSPKYYTYKIERSDYTTHTTLYEGEFIPNYTDENIKPNKNYLYTITPIYKDRIGKTVKLPSVSTTEEKTPFLQDQKILDKEWWEY